jgi:hypothetical protein
MPPDFELGGREKPAASIATASMTFQFQASGDRIKKELAHMARRLDTTLIWGGLAVIAIAFVFLIVLLT